MEVTLWIEERFSGELGGNARNALATISKNEEFINMTLAVVMTPEDFFLTDSNRPNGCI